MSYKNDDKFNCYGFSYSISLKPSISLEPSQKPLLLTFIDSQGKEAGRLYETPAGTFAFDGDVKDSAKSLFDFFCTHYVALKEKSASPPAPVSVLLPEPMDLSTIEHSKDIYDLSWVQDASHMEGWNACLAKVKELNQ